MQSRILLSLFILILIANKSLFAATWQESGEIRIEMDSVFHMKTDRIQSITIEIVNESRSDFTGDLSFNASRGLLVLGDTKRPVTLKAGERRFFPLRIRVNADADAGQSVLITSLTTEEGVSMAQAKTIFEIQEHRNIILHALTHRELIQHAGDSIRVPVQIRNTGNTDEEIRIVASIPQFHGQSDREFRTLNLYLQPLSDTTIIVRYLVDRQMLQAQEPFDINIAGLYEDSDVFGHVRVNVQNASANRSYFRPTDPLDYWDPNQNQIALTARNLMSNQPSWQLQGNATHLTKKGEIDFRFNLHQWAWDQTPSLNNTWFRYKQQNKAFTIGNISENLDKNIYGRGLKIHLGDSAETRQVDVGFVDKSYNLIGADYGQQWFDGYSVFVKMENGRQYDATKKHNAFMIYDVDPRENSESIMYSGNFEWINPNIRRNNLQLLWGGGLSRSLQDSTSSIVKPSIAGGLVYTTQLGEYHISSNNYVSTGYYPGTRKGFIQLNQRINRNFNRLSIWGNYNYSQFEPKSFHIHQYYQNFNRASRGELGVNLPISNYIQLSFAPRYESEEGLYMRNALAQRFAQDNLRVNTRLNWRSKNSKHFTSLINETGWTTNANFDQSEAWHFRHSLSYQFQRFNLTGQYQRGNFTIFENLYQTDLEQTPIRASASANWSNEYVNKRLQIQAGASFMSDQFAGESYSGFSRLQFSFNRTAVFAYGQLYQYYNNSYFSGPTVSLQAGITQKLPDNRRTQGVKAGKISISMFYDNNNNGIFDAGDTWAEGKSILIANTLFQADSRGEINYAKVPRGTYDLIIPVQQGWYAPARTILLDGRSKKWEIPLTRASTLKGRITYNFDPRISLDAHTTLEGFTVRVRAKNGFTTIARTDNSGQYTLFLPEGSYEIFLDEREFPANVYIENALQSIIVEAGVINTAPVFELKVKERTIEIKRFGT